MASFLFPATIAIPSYSDIIRVQVNIRILCTLHGGECMICPVLQNTIEIDDDLFIMLHQCVFTLVDVLVVAPCRLHYTPAFPYRITSLHYK